MLHHITDFWSGTGIISLLNTWYIFTSYLFYETYIWLRAVIANLMPSTHDKPFHSLFVNTTYKYLFNFLEYIISLYCAFMVLLVHRSHNLLPLKCCYRGLFSISCWSLASVLANREELTDSKNVMLLLSRMLFCIHAEGIRWIYFLKEESEGS